MVETFRETGELKHRYESCRKALGLGSGGDGGSKGTMRSEPWSRGAMSLQCKYEAMVGRLEGVRWADKGSDRESDEDYQGLRAVNC